MMAPVKRKVTFNPQAGQPMTLASVGTLQMLGHVVGEFFYTPDIGKGKWEVWNMADVELIKPNKE